MSSSKHQSKSSVTRLPAPSLFIGPPSRNASHTSLNPPPAHTQHTTPNIRGPLARQRSQLGRSTDPPTEHYSTLHNDSSTEPLQSPALPRRPHPLEKHSTSRTDAIWAEMQNTLEEVELNALSGTHVFGSEHSAALDALRGAQIALAQAWASSEGEEAERGGEDEVKAVESAAPGVVGSGASAERLEGQGRERSGTGTSRGSTRSRLEEDTENDILLARKRREANDRYFHRVNEGVLDVVSKLEDVARAMKAVEAESKDIWGDNGSSIASGTEGSVT